MVLTGNNVEPSKKLNAYFTSQQSSTYLMVGVDEDALTKLQYLVPDYVLDFQTGNYVMEFPYSTAMITILRLHGVSGALSTAYLL